MSDMKTVPSDVSPTDFLLQVPQRKRAKDAATVIEMMQRTTGEDPVMWGPSIIGFGRYNYTRKDGSAHSSFLTGVSPRKANLVLYVMPGFSKYGELLEKLGPHKTGACCLYLTRLEALDHDVLEALIARSVKDMRAMHPA